MYYFRSQDNKVAVASKFTSCNVSSMVTNDSWWHSRLGHPPCIIKQQLRSYALLLDTTTNKGIRMGSKLMRKDFREGPSTISLTAYVVCI